MVSDRNRTSQADPVSLTLSDRVQVGVAIGVVVLMVLLALGNHFFGIPASSPDMEVCEMSGYCGPQYPYWE